MKPWVLWGVLIPLLFACDDTDATGPIMPPARVFIQTTSTNRFLPSTVELAVGGTATFTFNGTGHNVTFDAAAGRPADVPTSYTQAVDRVFSTAGTFTYRCTRHTAPAMTGTIVVR